MEQNYHFINWIFHTILNHPNMLIKIVQSNNNMKDGKPSYLEGLRVIKEMPCARTKSSTK